MEVGKEKKTCYKVEPKLVCIPAIRLPWQKCQPTCSKTRTVKVLKKNTFECEVCKYSWSVVEPEIQDFESEKTPASTDASGQPIVQPAQSQYEPVPQHDSVAYEPIEQPVYEPSPAVDEFPGSVPQPPDVPK